MSDRHGQPGEPGEPGEPGIGGGGAGGRGGRGGRGASLSTGWKRWRALVGYVLLVLVVVTVVEINRQQNESDLRHIDREACQRSELIANNQAFVLKTLRDLLLKEAKEHDDHPELALELRETLERLVRVPSFECDGI